MITTPRLTIRQMTLDDLDDMQVFLSDPQTLDFWERPYTDDETRAAIERNIKSYADNGFGRWAVILKETGALIGICGIARSEIDGRDLNDLGYIFDKAHWGKGYATEAAQAVVDYAFEVLRLESITANMPHDHHASRRVAEHLGMVKIGEFSNPKNRGIRTFLYEIIGATTPG